MIGNTKMRLENDATYEKETALWISEGQAYQTRENSRCKGPEVGLLQSFKVNKESTIAR